MCFNSNCRNRATRDVNGKVIFYGDIISKSTQEAMDITTKRRKLQKEFNKKHNITPKTIIKKIADPIKAEI